MAWIDNIREAAITSPSGERITFDFEDLSYEYDPLGTAYNFVDVEGTYVQRQKNSSRRYPVRMYFHGAEYDTEVKVFESALAEEGFFKLEHPVYGVNDVVPFGTVKRRDDLKTAANQTVLDITWWATITELYPQSQVDPKALVNTELANFDAAKSTEFADKMDLSTVGLQAAFKGKNTSLLKGLGVSLSSVPTSFTTLQNKFLGSIDDIINDPLLIAKSIGDIILAPATFINGFKAKREYYSNLFGSGVLFGSSTDNRTARDKNEFITQDLYVVNYLSAGINTTVNGEFTTKPEAIAAAEVILNDFEKAVEWREQQQETLDLLDVGTTYEALQQLAAVSAGYLVQLSFSLKQERVIIIDRRRSIIDVVAELYGVIDEKLDFFISSNNLSGDEILELPAGKELVYYV